MLGNFGCFGVVKLFTNNLLQLFKEQVDLGKGCTNFVQLILIIVCSTVIVDAICLISTR